MSPEWGSNHQTHSASSSLFQSPSGQASWRYQFPGSMKTSVSMLCQALTAVGVGAWKLGQRGELRTLVLRLHCQMSGWMWVPAALQHWERRVTPRYNRMGLRACKLLADQSHCTSSSMTKTSDSQLEGMVAKGPLRERLVADNSSHVNWIQPFGARWPCNW